MAEDKKTPQEPEDARTKEANYQKLLAEVDKAKADAHKAAAEAQAEETKPFVPDLSKLNAGSLEVEGNQPLFGTALADRALDAAASGIVNVLKDALSGGQRVLITSDAHLAQADAAYVEVVTGLDQLTSAAKSLLADGKPQGKAAAEDERREVALAPLLPAAIGVIPGLVSLFSSRSYGQDRSGRCLRHRSRRGRGRCGKGPNRGRSRGSRPDSPCAQRKGP